LPPAPLPSSALPFPFPPSTIYSNFKGGKCLTYIGTEGAHGSCRYTAAAEIFDCFLMGNTQE
jgi:hypothetical protein